MIRGLEEISTAKKYDMNKIVKEVGFGAMILFPKAWKISYVHGWRLNDARVIDYFLRIV